MQAHDKLGPILFEPLTMERIWGGRALEMRFGKVLPDDKLIGEIWEIVDRPDTQSIIRNQPFCGCTLHNLWVNHRESIFGSAYNNRPEKRFPLLVKLLDAQQKLSVQVHPSPDIAAILAGESKTEMWYFLLTNPTEPTYVGLKHGVTRSQVEKHIQSGTIESLLHKIYPNRGQTMFVPSGRIHAIGAGSIIIEVQQNSDTTYRIFDWNRTTSEGTSRKLHIKESIASIDFNDHEPYPTQDTRGILNTCSAFQIELEEISDIKCRKLYGRFAIICVVEGTVNIAGNHLSQAEFCLLPASMETVNLLSVDNPAKVLIVTLPI